MFPFNVLHLKVQKILPHMFLVRSMSHDSLLRIKYSYHNDNNQSNNARDNCNCGIICLVVKEL